MDPNDLLFLHAQLAATIRVQDAEITRLKKELGELRDAAESAIAESDAATGSTITPAG